jgi:co-chaperonin GroES (HSP10)
VAVLQASIETTIELAGTEGQFKNEGLVIGVGPGIADGAGGRLKPSVEVGDYVMFGPRNIAATLEPGDGPYKGKKVVIVSERNILCSLPGSIPYEIEE